MPGADTAMTEPTRAILIPVDGPADKGDPAEGVTVQFNPGSLKVSLSNSLKANEKSENQSAAQYVDKSASSLAVELIFDTSIEDEDVRNRTKAIAEAFMKPVESGDEQLAPKRCLFQWGAFEFVGLMQSFDETLDFFSPEGTPLRATVALKLSEDRYQFRQGQARKSDRETPTLGSSGGGGVGDANKQAGKDERAWRDTALYNGLESHPPGSASGPPPAWGPPSPAPSAPPSLPRRRRASPPRSGRALRGPAPAWDSTDP